MFLRIKMNNFLSFYEETEFNMFPNLKKKKNIDARIYQNNKIPLLKQAVVYGANASGKSNFIQAFYFIKNFILKKDFLNNEIISKYKFRLTENQEIKPIIISLEFKSANEYFIYETKINHNLINEELYISGLGEKENDNIFFRDGSEFSSEEKNPKIINTIKKLIEKNSLSSLLSLNKEFPIIDNVKLKSIYEWFENKLNILSKNSFIPSLINSMYENENLLEFTKNILSKTDIGLKSLEIKSKNFDEVIFKDKKFRNFVKNKINDNYGFSRILNERVLFSITKEKDNFFIRNFVFKQLGIDNYSAEMDIEDQSDGTVKLLNLIPAIFDAIKNEKIICIDEIENSIHPSLISALIKHFSDSDSNGQLIFTTHETELLNQEKYMRADEVWFTEKHKGNTVLYSLNDFKEHNTVHIRNGYLEGRYGGIPFIDNL